MKILFLPLKFCLSLILDTETIYLIIRPQMPISYSFCIPGHIADHFINIHSPFPTEPHMIWGDNLSHEVFFRPQKGKARWTPSFVRTTPRRFRSLEVLPLQSIVIKDEFNSGDDLSCFFHKIVLVLFISLHYWYWIFEIGKREGEHMIGVENNATRGRPSSIKMPMIQV